MTQEIFKTISGFDNYMISNEGRVLNTKFNRFIKPCLIIKECGRKYYLVRLNKKNERTSFGLHQLIAKAFIPNPENKKCIDHINNNGLDNRISNLRWSTNQENSMNKIAKHQYKGVEARHGKFRARIGFDGKHIKSSPIATEQEAAYFYNCMAKNLFSEFAWLNNVHRPNNYKQVWYMVFLKLSEAYPENNFFCEMEEKYAKYA